MPIPFAYHVGGFKHRNFLLFIEDRSLSLQKAKKSELTVDAKCLHNALKIIDNRYVLNELE